MDKTIDSIDTSRTVVINGSTLGTVWKLVWSAIGLFVAGGLVALLMALLLEDRSGSRPPVYFLMAIGYFFVFLFALMVILCIGEIYQCWKFLKISNNVLTITPDGIRDRRVLEEFVSWRAGAFGDRAPIKDTRPWMTFTIDLWRLKNINASALYDICEAYATARAKQAA